MFYRQCGLSVLITANLLFLPRSTGEKYLLKYRYTIKLDLIPITSIYLNFAWEFINPRMLKMFCFISLFIFIKTVLPGWFRRYSYGIGKTTENQRAEEEEKISGGRDRKEGKSQENRIRRRRRRSTLGKTAFTFMSFLLHSWYTVLK